MSQNKNNHDQTTAVDELQAARRAMHLAKRRKYYAEHPQENLRYRLQSAVNFLNKGGFMVIPDPPMPPWTEEEAREILVYIARMKGFYPAQEL